MKNVLTGLLMALALFSFAYSQGKDDAVKQAEKELSQARKDMVEANKRQDLKLMDSLVSEDYFWISFNGHSGGKNLAMESLKAERPKDYSETMTEENVKIRSYNGMAIVTGVTSVAFTVAGESQSYKGPFTEVWVKKQGHWQIVSMQVTPSKTK